MNKYYKLAKSLAKRVLIKMGLRQPRTSLVLMKFPTFDASFHRLICGEGDYFRYATIGLAIRRILNENVLGGFAEVGVYQGKTSSFIHKLGPERVYYLFDTFDGFPAKDLEPSAPEDKRFIDTNVEIVLRTIGDQRNIVIRKGYVPDTFQGLEQETFAFVLLDLDLYKPTISSLQFFYPRLVKGGYLMIHDYNSPESNWACSRAVNEFMSGKAERIIEIADEFGSVMFRKL